MEDSGVGNRILSQWLRKVRAHVVQEGELSESAIKIPLFGEPNRISDELEKWRQQCPPPAAGLDPAAPREATKTKLLSHIDRKLDLLYAREEGCRARELSLEQAHQSAAVLPPAPTFERILRYETALERELYRAMNQLARLQRRRQGEAIPVPWRWTCPPLLSGKITKRTQKQNAKPPVKSTQPRPEPCSPAPIKPNAAFECFRGSGLPRNAGACAADAGPARNIPSPHCPPCA